MTATDEPLLCHADIPLLHVADDDLVDEPEFEKPDKPIRVRGFDLVFRVERDDDMGPPWEEHDGHGVVSDWTTRDKRPGERVLAADGRSKRYYDVQASVEIAKRDGWDAPPYGGTSGEKAARAVASDFDHLKRWCDDEWYWCCIIVSVSKNGVMLDEYAASLGGVDSDSEDYHVEVANEMIEQAIEAGRKIVAKVAA